MKSYWFGIFVALVLLSNATRTEAAFVSPSWSRPASDGQASADYTTFQHWNVFTSTTGPNSPDVAEINPPGAADAYDSSAPASGAFLTGGGNIYSFAAVITPRAIVPGFATGNPTDFLVQVRSQGQDIDVNGLTLGGVPVSTLDNYSYTELARTSLGGFGGNELDHAWRFTAPVDLSSFQLDWSWGVSSASLDQMLIDTQTVVAAPEPGTWALAAVGLVGLAVARRLRRSRRS